MSEILAALPAIVKPVDFETNAPVVALAPVPADDLIDDSWPLSDAEADWLAEEAASYAMYEAGHPAW